MALTDKLTAIGNAIRAKTGGTDALTLEQMVTEIEGISGGGGSTEEWIGDGNTHIWITLSEGRTSPMLGVCPQGTVTVDWGDGTTPDVLTGTSVSTVQWTPNHNYAEPGDYIITLTVDGKMGFGGSNSSNQNAYILRHASGSDVRNRTYQNAVHRVEIGNGVTSIANYAFYQCYALTSVNIPESVTIIGNYAFSSCYALTSVNIPESVTRIGSYAFSSCYSLTSVNIPESVTSIGNSVFQQCHSLTSVNIPESVTSIANYAFNSCVGVRFYDFSNHTVVPTLSNTNAFSAIPDDCEIRVPTALYDEWIAATNWSTYASHIVAV